jgi:hypothetical protein
MERNFIVDLIAQPIKVPPYGCSREAAIRWARESNFTLIPIAKEIDNAPWIEQLMIYDKEKNSFKNPRNLEISDFISESTSIVKALQILSEKQTHFLFVLTGDRIKTIVTLSDFNSLPVRTYLFTLMAHAEIEATDILDNAFPNDGWLAKLTEDTRASVEALYQKKQAADKDTRRVDCLSLSQKLNTLVRADEVKKYLKDEAGIDIDDDRKIFIEYRNKLLHNADIVAANDVLPEDFIRNQLAHHHPLIKEDGDPKSLFSCFLTLEKWIRGFASYKNNPHNG